MILKQSTVIPRIDILRSPSVSLLMLISSYRRDFSDKLISPSLCNFLDTCQKHVLNLVNLKIWSTLKPISGNPINLPAK